MHYGLYIMFCKTGNGFAQGLINSCLNIHAPISNIVGLFNSLKDDGKWVVFNNGQLLK